MSRARTRLAVAAVSAVAAVLLLAVSAQASEIALACSGKGPRNKDSAGTVLCAAAPNKARVVAGAQRVPPRR